MHEGIASEKWYNFNKMSFGKINNENDNDNKCMKIKHRFKISNTKNTQ